MADQLISLYRQKLAGEKGWIRKEWGGRCAIALAFPNAYRLGMSNLGFQSVYGLMNLRPDVLAERVFLPEDPEITLYRQTGRPLLSLESQSPVRDFQLLAFSLPFENDYPNILKILDLAKVPLAAEDRRDTDPFVMAGGVTTFLNPEPLAHFVDFFLLGEAEETLQPFLDLFVDSLRRGTPRGEILRRLAAQVPSLYVPSLYHVAYAEDGRIASFSPKHEAFPSKITVGRPRRLTPPPARSRILTAETEFGGRPLVELGRGCGRSCRFCAAGYVYRPPRWHTVEDLRTCIDGLLTEHGEIGLLAPCVNDLPEIEALTGLILERGGSFSASSLRADALTPVLLAHLKAAGRKTVTIAPEAGSERLRRVINKHLSRQAILDAARSIAETSDFALRLYFLIGLPTETQEDLSEMVRLVKAIKHQMIKASAPRGTLRPIRLSINCFVPKPFTPFQWFNLQEVRELKKKQAWLKQAFAREGGVKATFDVPRWAYIQALLALGDRRVSRILMDVHLSDGNWKKALKESEINPDFFVSREKALDEILPWDFIDHGIRKEHLLREYRLALAEEESDICEVGKCRRCGVCGPPE